MNEVVSSYNTDLVYRLETSMDDYAVAVTVAVVAYRRRKQGIKNIN